MKILSIGLVFGGISGFLAIAFGAYAEHVLRPELSPQDFESLETALRYQLIHAGIMVGVGAMRFFAIPYALLMRLRLVVGLFILGSLQFCGGIFIGVTTQFREALHLAPIGGALFMLGWLVLASAGLMPNIIRKPETRPVNLSPSRRRR